MKATFAAGALHTFWPWAFLFQPCTYHRVGAKDERRALNEARSSAGCEDGGVEGKDVDSIEAGEETPPPFSSLIFSSSRILFSNGDLTEGRDEIELIFRTATY